MLRRRSLAGLLLLCACSSRDPGAAVATGDGAAPTLDGGNDGAGGMGPLRFCDGVPPVLDADALTAPYVMVEDGIGESCVFTEGQNYGSVVCGQAAISALNEPNCPSTSLMFDVFVRPLIARGLYLQGGYADVLWNGVGQHGKVQEMVIDRTEGTIATGHFRATFPAVDRHPELNIRGRFSLCAAAEPSVEPCRDM